MLSQEICVFYSLPDLQINAARNVFKSQQRPSASELSYLQKKQRFGVKWGQFLIFLLNLCSTLTFFSSLNTFYQESCVYLFFNLLYQECTPYERLTLY